MAKRTAKQEESRAHSAMLRVRVLPELDELIRTAAEHAAARLGTGTVSDWIRSTLKAAAERELSGSG